MEYGVFQINEDGLLIFVAKFDTRAEAIANAKTGTNMVVLEIYN